jgi:glycosyltransferase involved in cell wall biosynthesis
MSKVMLFTMAYDAEGTLRRAIDSILAQDYGDWVYFCVDNGSTDRTGEIIAEYAARDGRITALRNEKNLVWMPGNEIHDCIAKTPEAFYFACLDADDLYMPDFLSRMVSFAEENNLDIAAAGSVFINRDTDEIVRTHVPESMLIVDRVDFAKEFIHYRKFHWSRWGKLFKITAEVRETRHFYPVSDKNAYIYGDMEMNLTLLQNAKRIGLFPEILHKYFKSDKSYFSAKYYLCELENHAFLYNLMCEFLRQFGEIGKLNTDYLNAIWMGFMEEEAGKLFASDLDVKQKQQYARKILSHPITQEMIDSEPDERFVNLRSRKEFPKQMDEMFRLSLASRG